VGLTARSTQRPTRRAGTLGGPDFALLDALRLRHPSIYARQLRGRSASSADSFFEDAKERAANMASTASPTRFWAAGQARRAGGSSYKLDCRAHVHVVSIQEPIALASERRSITSTRSRTAFWTTMAPARPSANASCIAWVTSRPAHRASHSRGRAACPLFPSWPLRITVSVSASSRTRLATSCELTASTIRDVTSNDKLRSAWPRRMVLPRPAALAPFRPRAVATRRVHNHRGQRRTAQANGGSSVGGSAAGTGRRSLVDAPAVGGRASLPARLRLA